MDINTRIQQIIFNNDKRIELEKWKAQHQDEILRYFNKYTLIRNCILINEAQRYRKNKFKDKDNNLFSSLNEEVLNKKNVILMMQSLSYKHLFNENA